MIVDLFAGGGKASQGGGVMCCALLALTIGLVVGFAVASIVCASDDGARRR